MSTERALRLIREIRSEWHKPINPKHGKREQHEFNAYELWAFDEIYIWVLENDKNPIDAIYELMELADDVQANAKMEHINFAFNVLYDMSEEVYDVLRMACVADW